MKNHFANFTCIILIFITFNSFAIFVPDVEMEHIQVSGSTVSSPEYCYLCGSLPKNINPKNTETRYLSQREYLKLLDFSECLRNSHKEFTSCIETGQTIAMSLDKVCKLGAILVGSVKNKLVTILAKQFKVDGTAYAKAIASFTLIEACDFAYKDAINRTSPQYCQGKSNDAEEVCFKSVE